MTAAKKHVSISRKDGISSNICQHVRWRGRSRHCLHLVRNVDCNQVNCNQAHNLVMQHAEHIP